MPCEIYSWIQKWQWCDFLVGVEDIFVNEVLLIPLWNSKWNIKYDIVCLFFKTL
jgi:hypothetical protein